MKQMMYETESMNEVQHIEKVKKLWKLVKNGYINLVQICTNLYSLIFVSILMYR